MFICYSGHTAGVQQEGMHAENFWPTKAVPVYSAEFGQPLQTCTTHLTG